MPYFTYARINLYIDLIPVIVFKYQLLYYNILDEIYKYYSILDPYVWFTMVLFNAFAD